MPEKLRCKAMKLDGSGHCGNWAIPGLTVCKYHGGSTTHARMAGRRRVLMEHAREVVRGFTIEPVEDPLTKLKEIAGELLAVKDFLHGRIEEIEDLRSRSRDGVEQMRAEFTAYQHSLRDVVSVLSVIAKLNIDERLTRIEQAKVELIVAAVDAALHKAGVTGDQASAARHEVARRLRSVA